ncbi:MAG: ATP-binding protein [Gammaproteobacteria bacterium]
MTTNIIGTIVARNTMIKKNNGMLNFLQLKLKKYPLSQWNNKIAKMRPKFSAYIKVLPISELDLSTREINKLKKKGILIKQYDMRIFLGIVDSNIISYKIIPNTQYVFKTHELSLSEIFRYMLAWNNQLIVMELQNTPKKQWNQMIKKIQKIYGYPLLIIKQTSAGLSAAELDNLRNNDATVEETGKKEIQNFYAKIPDTNFLIRSGPMPIDYLDKYEVHLIYAAFLCVMLCFLFVSHLFFGRAIRKIFTITDHYSRGDFNFTTTLSKYSSMYRVYDNIVEMGQRIKNLMKSQQALTRLVAHESRIPISRMLFILEKMEKLQSAKELQQNIGYLKENLNELNDLTNNFLCYSRLTSKQFKLNFKAENIIDFIKASVDKLIHNKKNIKILSAFNLSKIKCAKVDKKYIGYVLDNLLDNAIRFAKKHLKISAWDTDEKLYIAVDDDGIVIPDEDKKIIFEPFIRLEQEHNGLIEGYGLGLSIVKTIVELHHGTIEVSDSTLKGTKFLIALPISFKH